ncbi:MAG: hypothetical protein R3C15_08410 [Thermoleophilia bacterium]
MAADETLAYLRELAGRDASTSTALAELDRLAEATGAIRARADAVAALLAAAPAERARLAADVAEGRAEADRRAATLADAERELSTAEQGRDAERLAAARRFVVRARDSLSIATRRLAEAEEAQAALERRVAEAERDAPLIERQAAEVAAELAGRARVPDEAARPPAPGLGGVAEWAVTARAALFVARGGTARERDEVIRQANELGSVVLGEALASASVATILARVERG